MDPMADIAIGTYVNRPRLATLFADVPFLLECGSQLSPIEVAYETWGSPDHAGSNAVLLVHALTGDSHAASHGREDREGWFEGMIGPGRALDPGRHFIVCANWLGSNYGTTGPASPDPATGKPYGQGFPAVAIADVSRAFKALGDHLGIERWKAVIGGSVGGFVTLDFAARFPRALASAVPIATSFRASPWVIAFHEIMRRILSLGEESGREDLLRRSLEVARMVGMVTYRSRSEFVERYRRDRADLSWQERGCCFAVESYLVHHGIKLDRRFDPAAYACPPHPAHMSDLGETHGSLEQAVARISCPVLSVGVRSDYLFPVEEQREIVDALEARRPGQARLGLIDSPYGHDGFLIEFEQLGALIGSFLSEDRT